MTEPASAFARYVARPDAEISLAEAALLFASELYPGLDVTRYLLWLDAQGHRARERFDPQSTETVVLEGMRQLLFDELGFHGNAERYYDECNSYLNEVIDRRTGIPITLSLVYLEIGRRAGIHVEGVGLPGHFIVRVRGSDWEALVDPYHRGNLLTDKDCAQLMAQAAGKPVPLLPAYVRPIGNRAILARLLSNLQAIHLNAGNWDRALHTVTALCSLHRGATPPANLLRVRGFLHFRLERWDEAERDWLTYLSIVPEAGDAMEIRLRIEQMRTNMARRN